MMPLSNLNRLGSNERGMAAVEFALVAPVMILMIIGAAQLGILFLANSGLRHAVGEGARFATIHPRPTESQIRSRIRSSTFGLDSDNVTMPPFSYGTTGRTNYVDIAASYTVRLDFIFFSVPPVELSVSRRAFIHATN